jgi:hypothetical protein
MKKLWSDLMLKLIEYLENRYVAEEDRNAYLQDMIGVLQTENAELIAHNSDLQDEVDYYRHERR